MVEYRPLGEDHREEYWEYTKYAFRPESGPEEYDPEEHESDQTALGNRRGIFDDDAASDDPPRCVCAHYWFETQVRGEWHPAPGLSAVASPPENRRAGYVETLLASSLAEYRDRNDRFSLLWPFRYRFYQQYGWDTCSAHRSYSCEPSTLSFAQDEISENGRYRSLEAEDFDTIAPVYESYADRYTLSIRRDEDWWRHRVFSGWWNDPYVYVWERDGQPRGYLAYTIEGEWGDRTMTVRDLAVTDTDALLALFAFWSNHDSQVKEVRFRLPTDVRVLDLVPEPEEVDCEYELGAMARIVDVETTLPALQCPAVDGRVALSIEDPLVEWNDRTFLLTVTDGDATCKPVAADHDPELSVDIGVLTQLVVGYRSARQLQQDGRLDASDDVVDTLDRLYPRERTYLGTGF